MRSEASDRSSPFDLLLVPGLGRLLHWRHARTLLQIPVFLVSVAMIVHGLSGPTLAPKNLATTLTWVHFRGALVLVLLAAGNFFCLACPFLLVRNFARRFLRPRFAWPRRLRNKWMSVGLFALILFSYELFDLWASPFWTAMLILGYFLAILAIDGFFRHASFCKYVCPIGQFNFIASTVSPLEIQVREKGVCDTCATNDCIRGRRDPVAPLVVIQRGCELALFQPLKVGNMDCTFCLDCVHACPHDNVGIMSRIPAGELMMDPRRSGIGFFSRRMDIGALALLFTFGALVNALGMVSPVYALEKWIGKLLRVESEAPVLAVIFVFCLIVEPVLLVGMAAWITRWWGGSRRALLPLAVRYSYGLVPIGFAIWLAHYGFHFLTGLFTFIPVAQSAARGIFGQPRWDLTGLPRGLAQPMEMGFLALGLAGSMLVCFRLAQEDVPDRALRAFAPWAALCILLFAGAVWLMLQPMEMRGTLLGMGG